MQESKIPVLIVGAGPTGLMAACQMARYGVPFRIIEKNEGTTPLSKALAVQARTLEIYDQLGIGQKAVARGQQARAVNMLIEGKKIQRVPLGDIGAELSPHPFMLILEQSKNEALLYELLRRLGGEVEWNKEMCEITQDEEQARVRVRHTDGSEETIHAEWVIAADGGKSPIRHALGCQFEGGTYESIFYVADVEVDWDLGYGELFVNLVNASFCGFFPMGGKRFRLVGILPPAFEKEEDVTFEHICETIQKEQKIALTFGQTNWFALYRVHHRVIDSFRKGRCFFAGDAAHVHSPAGGQGMNTGLQDAHNLGWKLALFAKGLAKPELLDTYNEERLPNAHELVNSTDRAFSNVVAKGAMINFFKMHVLPFVAGTVMGWETVRRLAFKTVSQIRIHYREHSLSSQNLASVHKEMPHAGDRLPFVQVYDETLHEHVSLFQWLQTTRFVALMWVHNEDPFGEKEVDAVKNTISAQFPDLFDFHTVHNITENMVTFARLHITRSTLFVVRPDGYIGYIGGLEDLQGVEGYLRGFLQ